MIDLRLTPAAFDGLAGGYGGRTGIGELREAQVSKHLLLIRFLLDQLPATSTSPGNLLERSRVAAPEEFRSVIGAPLVGAWAAIAGRAATLGTVAEADLSHLNAIAIVAAAATGVDGCVQVPVQHGRAVLPGLGAVVAGDAATVAVTAQRGRLLVTTDRGGLEVPAGPEREVSGWEPVRVLSASSAGLRIRLGLDDVHPYRHGYHVPPANRLPAAEVDRWRALFDEAWELLAVHLPERAAELVAGLETLVPLAQTDARSARSATLRHAVGVFGLTLPPTPHDFAVTLVHEFQHSKLSALLDLTRLTDPADDRRYFAPWRTDPRPLAGLLQGVYAFVGVADTWRALQGTVGVATARFAEARLQVDRGLRAIEESGALTGDGEAFIARLRRTADRLLAEPLPGTADEDARAALARTYAAWRDHNGT
ncbi:HEXXH motif domain-containing protein [Actinoplanes sp. NPDC051633]|uniref:HEXXH motif domain-containing protein n=1 Tax=Actinoplanes sp. NPDC051633 TaxID=3155670 RepID=UPI003427B22E